MTERPSRLRAGLEAVKSSPIWVRGVALVVVAAVLLGVRLVQSVPSTGSQPPPPPVSTPAGPFADVSQLALGSCITVFRADPTTFLLTVVDCDDPAIASYTVVSSIEKGSCDPAYLTQTYPDEGKKYSYCLMENLLPDSCYAELTGTQQGYATVPCGPQAKFRVTKRIDGRADRASCGPDQATVAYPLNPQRTYCLAAPR